MRRFLSPAGSTLTSHLLMTLTYAIKEGFSYERREESGVQSPRRTLDRRRGSCRDFAVLMMEAARALGIAARFVSGYVYVPSDDEEPVRLGGGATHAWCQIYLPGAGWLEFDPTNGLIGGKDLIRVAVARDPAQAAPLTGAFFGNGEDEMGMDVFVEVTQPNHAQRVTLRGQIAPGTCRMIIRAGYAIAFECSAVTPMILHLNIHPSRDVRPVVARRRANGAGLSDRGLSRSVRQPGDAGRGASRSHDPPQ